MSEAEMQRLLVEFGNDLKWWWIGSMFVANLVGYITGFFMGKRSARRNIRSYRMADGCHPPNYENFARLV